MKISWKNAASLLNFLKMAPLQSIQLFVDEIQKHSGFEALKEVSPADGDAPDADQRKHYRTKFAKLPEEVRTTLDGHTAQILELSDDAADSAQQLAREKAYTVDIGEPALDALLDEAPDAIGRATILFTLAPDLFRQAQAYFHSDYFRNLGKLYDAFDIDTDKPVSLQWDENTQADLEKAICTALATTGQCRVEYVPIKRSLDDGTVACEHLFLIRHAGDKRSVQNTNSELETEPLYYTPPVESTVKVIPENRTLEVLCKDRSARARLAQAVSHHVLEVALSGRPMTLRQYDLSRFYESLQLPQDVLDGLDEVSEVRLVELDLLISAKNRRVSVKVQPDDDLEEAMQDIFGDKSPLQRDYLRIVRVVLNASLLRGAKTVNMPITISTPNRCNISSKRDQRLRDLSTTILNRYGILICPSQFQNEDIGTVFTTVLRLFEAQTTEVRLRDLQAWGSNLDLLLAGGFLKMMGPANTVKLIDDDGRVQTLSVRENAGRLIAVEPETDILFGVDPDDLVRYQVAKDWVAECVIKSLGKALSVIPAVADGGLVTRLGELQTPAGARREPTRLGRRGCHC